MSKTFGSAKRKKLRETLEAFHDFGLEEELKYSEEYENFEGEYQPDSLVKAELDKQKQTLDNLVQERQQYFVNKLTDST